MYTLPGISLDPCADMTSVQPKAGTELPLSGLTRDGWSNADEATATCSCGAIQMVLPIKAPGLVNTFVCHCSDCRNWSASVFATNLTTLDSHTRFVRGEDHLVLFSQSETISKHRRMTNAFCKLCGTLMYRQGAVGPGTRFMRGGPIDDHELHNTILKPQWEIFTEHRASWIPAVPGARQEIGMGDFDKQ
ncbi:Mss4-like protein [Kockovaella imperatae]|uniref:Mss4-like protein n=1 Tax=Kockovaella imperatae TaxID=4999 RepID=A0A1Y1UDW5_9TREE|nr:Mss4-like protein [Kockovaella imperatae]ORX36212.1 Mss4-like protein [Kockovaella imperatae]